MAPKSLVFVGSLVGIGAIVCLVVVLSVVLVVPQKDVDKDILVKAEQGNIVGIKLPDSGMFYGIPFSQPPTGNYRWRQPREPLPFPDQYWNATYKRPACPQICDQPAAEYSCPHETDEDCLYLNVWIPSRVLTKVKSDDVLSNEHYVVASEYQQDGQGLPVMVWFYGGNFRNGAGTCTLYDGRYLAEFGDVIIVTTNYRVAHLGFLVQGTEWEESQGNFGFWDQIKTLEWVQKNIENFGGNPNKVTLFGQSAGAESIGVHLTSSYSEDLFQQAIMQSNPFGLPFRDLSDAQDFGAKFAEAAGCSANDMICLRSKNVKELEKAFNDTELAVTDPSKLTVIFQPWSPVIDNDLVPGQPIKLFMEGKAQKKPMITGSTVDEGMIFVGEAFPRKMNNTAYGALLAAVFKRDYPAIIEQYPPACADNTDPECDNRYILNDVATDALFICPQRNAIKSSVGSNQWWYIFNQTWSFYEVWEMPLCYDKVCHAAELAYLFNVEDLTTYAYTSDERAFSTRLLWYWTNFAKYGSPDGLGTSQLSSSKNVIEATYWPKFNQQSSRSQYEALQLTANGDSVMQKPYEEICRFWDELDVYAEHY